MVGVSASDRDHRDQRDHHEGDAAEWEHPPYVHRRLLACDSGGRETVIETRPAPRTQEGQRVAGHPPGVSDQMNAWAVPQVEQGIGAPGPPALGARLRGRRARGSQGTAQHQVRPARMRRDLPARARPARRPSRGRPPAAPAAAGGARSAPPRSQVEPVGRGRRQRLQPVAARARVSPDGGPQALRVGLGQLGRRRGSRSGRRRWASEGGHQPPGERARRGQRHLLADHREHGALEPVGRAQHPQARTEG